MDNTAINQNAAASLLRVEGLGKRYSGFALQDVALEVPAGSVVGLVGANGAGKTTTLKALLGLISADEGRASYFGCPPLPLEGQLPQDIKARLGVVFDACSFPHEMSVVEVGRLMPRLYPTWDAKAFDELCIEFQLPADRKAKELSRGMGMKLMLAVALSHNAQLLVLDEATAGLDPLARDEILDILRHFMERPDRGILLSSHITSDLEKIADYLVCIDEGRVAFACEKEAITDQAGIARCRAGQVAALQESGFFALGGMRCLMREFGTDVLVEDRFAFAKQFPDVVLDRATIDEYLALRLRGSLK